MFGETARNSERGIIDDSNIPTALFKAQKACTARQQRSRSTGGERVRIDGMNTFGELSSLMGKTCVDGDTPCTWQGNEKFESLHV